MGLQLQIALLREGVWHWLGVVKSERYRPERHYMRGPGPATLRGTANEEADPKHNTEKRI
ncbi:hypothetical protein DY251_14295 [Mesorhizobium denitrificans]|uniref:Uncharacterized protein n=1 Tax=Mesorhizobium denitrificans TaxID=2294114 RepID=A0A371XCQ5_9HYPH|nr:hypothetical protein DY251_14295 [Mesorhizobium denitrificans]